MKKPKNRIQTVYFFDLKQFRVQLVLGNRTISVGPGFENGHNADLFARRLRYALKASLE